MKNHCRTARNMVPHDEKPMPHDFRAMSEGRRRDRSLFSRPPLVMGLKAMWVVPALAWLCQERESQSWGSAPSAPVFLWPTVAGFVA